MFVPILRPCLRPKLSDLSEIRGLSPAAPEVPGVANSLALPLRSLQNSRAEPRGPLFSHFVRLWQEGTWRGLLSVDWTEAAGPSVPSKIREPAVHTSPLLSALYVPARPEQSWTFPFQYCTYCATQATDHTGQIGAPWGAPAQRKGPPRSAPARGACPCECTRRGHSRGSNRQS